MREHLRDGQKCYLCGIFTVFLRPKMTLYDNMLTGVFADLYSPDILSLFDQIMTSWAVSCADLP